MTPMDDNKELVERMAVAASHWYNNHRSDNPKWDELTDYQKDCYRRQMRDVLAVIEPELQKRDIIIETLKNHAIYSDCGRLCDGNKDIKWRDQWENSEEYVEGLIRIALKTTTGHDSSGGGV